MHINNKEHGRNEYDRNEYDRNEYDRNEYLMDSYRIDQKVGSYSNIYIYGAGLVGRRVYEYLRKRGLNDKVKMFVVSNEQKIKEIYGISIVTLKKVNIPENSVILISATKQVRHQMIRNCIDHDYWNFIEINAFDERSIDFYRWIKEEYYEYELKAWYRNATGKEIDLSNPLSLNEKINWMKIYDKDERKTVYADKYLVREYVKNKIGEDYLVPIYGVWEKTDDIDFTKLPDRFILKCNHGAGWNIIIKDKRRINTEIVNNLLNEWMNTNYAYVSGLELHYRGIQPRIIAEKYLQDKEQENVLDYKVYTFNGNARFIQVDINRFGEHRRNVYSLDWRLLEYEIRVPNDSNIIIKKPKYLKEMVSLAETLADDFNFVRVDFYIINDKIFFGEMTFTPGSGVLDYKPEGLDKELGALLLL